MTMVIQPLSEGRTASVGEPRMRANAVGFLGVLAESISDVAPSASVALVVPVVFVIAGAGAWLSWLIVTAVMLCVAYCCAEFTRRHATTGGLIGIVAGTGFPGIALAVAACVLGFVLLVSPITVLGTGLLLQNLLRALGVASSGGLLLALSLTALTVGFYTSYRDIRISAVVMLVIEFFTIVALAILMVVVLVEHRRGGILDSSQLALRGVSLHRILLGSATAIFAVASFECSATLGQESRSARKAIPRSLYASILLSGAILSGASYVMTLGFESTNASLASSSDPLSDLSVMYGASALRYVVLAGVAFGGFAATVAFSNWGGRAILTLAREGVLPKYFAAIDARTRTPARAVAGLAAMAFVFMIGLVIAGRATLAVYGYLATTSALMYTSAYLLAMLALGAYGRRTLRNVWMPIAAAIGIPTFVYVIYSAVHPEPAYPLDVWTWVGVGISAAACLLALVLSLARAPVTRSFGRSVQIDTRLAELDEAAESRRGLGYAVVATRHFVPSGRCGPDEDTLI
jgi:amino acid transporter